MCTKLDRLRLRSYSILCFERQTNIYTYGTSAVELFVTSRYCFALLLVCVQRFTLLYLSYHVTSYAVCALQCYNGGTLNTETCRCECDVGWTGPQCTSKSLFFWPIIDVRNKMCLVDLISDHVSNWTQVPDLCYNSSENSEFASGVP